MVRKKLLLESLLVYLLFCCVHFFLIFYFPYNFIDVEELEYGNLAIAFLDRYDVDLGAYQVLPREGSVFLTFLPVIGMFLLAGPTLLSLKVVGVLLSGLWAFVWYVVARIAFPRLNALLVGLLIAIPVPLIMLDTLNITSVLTHLGSSIWHGAVLLALLVSFEKMRKVNVGLVLASLMAGIGVFYCYSLLPLLAGVAWFIWKRGNLKQVVAWGCILVAVVAIEKMIVPNSFGTSTLNDLTTEELTVERLIDQAFVILAYGTGFAQNDNLSALSYGHNDLFYNMIGLLYSISLLGLLAFLLLKGTLAAPGQQKLQTSDVTISLLISSVAFLVVLFVSGFKLELDVFDGLRYLDIIMPLVVFGILEAANRVTVKKARWILLPFIAMHILGAVLLGYPFEEQKFLQHVKGYSYHAARHIPVDIASLEYEEQYLDGQDSTKLKSRQRRIRRPDKVHRRRQEAFWKGVYRAYASGASQKMDDYADEKYLRCIKKRRVAFKEYWRGVGFGLAAYGHCEATGLCYLPDAPENIQKLNWQGASVLFACKTDLEQFIVSVPDKFHQDIFWGLGRGTKWIKWVRQYGYCDQNPPQYIVQSPSYNKGIEEGWMLDISPYANDTLFSANVYKELYIYIPPEEYIPYRYIDEPEE